MKDRDATDFGHLAVTLGFLSREELTRAVVQQEQLAKAGVTRRIGEICLEREYLTRDEVLFILRAQGKRIMTCPLCRKAYNVHHYRLGKDFACKHCKNSLEVPPRPVNLGVNGSIRDDCRPRAKTRIRTKVKSNPKVISESKRTTRPIGPITTRKEKVPQDLVRLFSGYELTHCLGRGGMGSVYKARDKILKRWVAVKVLAPFLANNDEYVARFFSESRNLRKLNHPNIVAAYDAGVEGEYKFFIMEYVDGVPLDRLMEQDERLPERRSLKIVRQVADALDYAWGRRIIHRDIKPSNIMIARQRRVKLCDLGLSKDVTSDVSITMTDSINCSPPYASPEQAQGMKDLDCRSDIYSLGVVLFQMVVGDLPFNAESPGRYLIQHVTEPPPDPLDMNPDLSPRSARLILRMLQKDPRERPTPGEVAVLIKKYLSGQARRL